MYKDSFIENGINTFDLEEFIHASESRTIYGKYMDKISSLGEKEGKKYFLDMKRDGIIDFIRLEKKLIDLD